MMTALLVQPAGEGGPLPGLLKQAGYSQVMSAQTGVRARQLIARQTFDLILCNAPLQDETGERFCCDCAARTDAGVVLIVGRDRAGEMGERVGRCGVFTVPKPMSQPLFFQAVQMAQIARQRLCTLRRENVQLQKRIDEIRLVDRAKCALIQYLQMSEPQAHRYLEKQAMDMRLTRAEVARRVLQTYEGE
ncbi:ANTAR domain-containing response regulator [Bittarella massiliensis (ex Durand et al. 2017)]|uniref:ANTAR domain-containing response regulator n=1 Tax=Bittarella massiliensis (ex Durand et al. 2017) TaxID=1720313 RepID=UPI001AA0E34F|nr:ANTAR domain-containing protein [Bittarella massiliensis (ex Durand et al. 2017)]MBO1679323.1 ANTAR domain-containing protein [Bittarella massiliensis (ex Durand et al. 2017)]